MSTFSFSASIARAHATHALAAGGNGTQPLDVARQRLAEEALVFPVEVRGIVIAHAIAGGEGVEIAREVQTSRFLKAQMLLKR